MNSGWQCPKCGAVWAPFVHQCARCNAPAVQQSATVPSCAHEWIKDTAGTRCWKCGMISLAISSSGGKP